MELQTFARPFRFVAHKNKYNCLFYLKIQKIMNVRNELITILYFETKHFPLTSITRMRSCLELLSASIDRRVAL